MKVTTSYLIDNDSDNSDEQVKSALIKGVEKATDWLLWKTIAWWMKVIFRSRLPPK